MKLAVTLSPALIGHYTLSRPVIGSAPRDYWPSMWTFLIVWHFRSVWRVTRDWTSLTCDTWQHPLRPDNITQSGAVTPSDYDNSGKIRHHAEIIAVMWHSPPQWWWANKTVSTTRKERLEECGSRKEYIFVVDLSVISVISCFYLSEENLFSWSRSCL